MRPTLEQVYAEHPEKVARLSALLQELEKTGLEAKEVLGLLKQKALISIPAEALNCGLSPLEAVVAYLSISGYSLTQSAELLGRHVSTIWMTLKKARRKHLPRKRLESRYPIPLSLLAERRLSVLEHAATYLKSEHGLSAADIARVLGRNVRTIWTVLGRARRKEGT